MGREGKGEIEGKMGRDEKMLRGREKGIGRVRQKRRKIDNGIGEKEREWKRNREGGRREE